jgi:hypothetical protein
MQYSFIDSITLPEKAEPLERGDLLHKMFEFYYGSIGRCLAEDSEVKQGADALRLPADLTKHEDIVQGGLLIGDFFATKMSLPSEEVDSVKFQFKEYAKFYEHDEWRPLAVEGVASKILYEDDDISFVYNGKIDMVAEHGKITMPWDHKSSQRRQIPSGLSNQFRGYAWLLGSDYVLVNKIGFQKTLKPGERFTRDILTYSKAQLEEWRENTIWWCYQIDAHLQAKEFPMNLTSCDKFSGCIYANLCERDPESREWVIDRDYKKQEHWDVAAILEAK